MADEMPPNSESAAIDSIREPIDELALDTIFDLLSHRYRRKVIDLLTTYDRGLTTSDIRNLVAEQERDADITEIPSDWVEQLHLTLHHVHLPKLADAGVIHYDHKQQLVEPTQKLDLLYQYYRDCSGSADLIRCGSGS
jgi:hypothetical protein